ncbi:hypothetical protein SPRG_04372 [Saprolegnia parasitica CBS 223.65]|uniref:Uncharacterized protein n=1 Tax=Saprolegnia parasitica (strain CBS 223.65) TaxID=695850 RepID=A0A067CI95_SAPPC|nr:hypothetical protein SPRG_04372 [Saprolegnia parasitica CBS 223.65]KDO30469.1 hypothetical protein SPRG_04372 [Saprolegnia parasitica CBS 223.65]|eukprot:XP_012198691.1 hypothetical protein SPRG_04372 [Saprolegnia parasitica CBS 223.65]
MTREDVNLCRVLQVASTPAFTIESSRRKAEPLGPDVLVTFSKLFAPESSIRVKAMQLQTLYDFLSTMALPQLVFVQPQIQKQLHELIYKPPRAASKRKRAITGDASVFAALWSAYAPAATAPTAKARVEVGVNLLYDIVRHLPFMHKLIFQRDGPWRLGATPELYNCWVENTARAMDALLAKPGLTLAGFCAKLDTPLSEPVPLDQFLRLLPTLHPTDYVDPPSLPHQGAFTASWTLDPARLELRHVAALPTLSLMTVLRSISMLSGFSLSLVQPTLHMRSYAEWLPTAWTTYVLDGRLHPCDAVLPNGEPVGMIALDHYIGWHKDTKLRVDLFGPNLRLSVRCALTKETEMDMDVMAWATPSGDDGAADLPDDVLDARCARLLHATGGFAAEG